MSVHSKAQKLIHSDRTVEIYMALEKAHSSNKKMTFGENRDLKQIVTQPVVSGKVKRVNVNFDEEKHIRFKAACARKGTSITDVINHLVDGWLKENE